MIGVCILFEPEPEARKRRDTSIGRAQGGVPAARNSSQTFLMRFRQDGSRRHEARRRVTGIRARLGIANAAWLNGMSNIGISLPS
jgi:hypothetical protein